MSNETINNISILNWFKDILNGFWTVIVGMAVTIRHFIKRPVTMHYPDEKWAIPDSFRGLLKCDVEACIACELCEKTCPVSCINIGWKREEGKTGKICTKFEVDYNKCMYCGLCTEPCPTNAVFHSHDYENSLISKDNIVIDYYLPKYKVKNPDAKPRKAV